MLARHEAARPLSVIDEASRELIGTFRASPHPRAAHYRAHSLLRQLSADDRFLTNVLDQHLRTPGVYEAKNYPVVSFKVALNPYFEIAVNAWIPLPDGATNVSTKAIHHHGTMLLSTANIFGPGYEHWTFQPPRLLDASRDIYSMDLIEQEQHGMHHVAFVDAHEAHLPLYPKSLSVTLALWSNSTPVSWKDWVKRIPILKKNERPLKKIAKTLGIARRLELKVPEYFDFYPTSEGFKGMKVRQEFALGPNEDHLHSLFHVIQTTGNARLGRVVRTQLGSIASPSSRSVVEKLLGDLEADRPIAGRLSSGHYDIPFANFTSDEIKNAMRALPSKRD